MKILEVHGWHTQCGECGYGRGGWPSSPANQGKPILVPESKECPGCKAIFTHICHEYGDGRLEEI
jgi:hypothetical protein